MIYVVAYKGVFFMKHIIIVNSTLLNNRLQKFLDYAKKTFEERNLSYEIFVAHSIEERYEFLMSLQKKSRIYIIGGDGTLHRSLHSFVHSIHELVLIPFGTGNDFARMLVHKKNPYKQFLSSLDLNAKPIDILKINQTYCINTACFALDNDVANHVHDAKNSIIPKQLSYIFTLVRRLFVYEPNHVEIYVDQEKWFDGKCLLFTVNNARFYGGGFCMTPKASIHDGQFNLTLIKDFNLLKLVYKIWPLLTHAPQKLKECIQLEHHKIKIISSQGMNLDGEFYPDNDIDIEVIPKSLLLVNEVKEV
jgi:YegS/Rv2252/BmrU family lipid kinase